jgi:hypothetical protein
MYKICMNYFVQCGFGMQYRQKRIFTSILSWGIGGARVKPISIGLIKFGKKFPLIRPPLYLLTGGDNFIPRMPCQIGLRWRVSRQARILIGQSRSPLPIGILLRDIQLTHVQRSEVQLWKRCFLIKFFTLNEANTLVALPNAWRRSVRALS